eukprot:CAMPEP_0182606076 /NCGR_PEP_ID=MMETSP1330-20130603/986_1 /TAXON_ID=464278 /ORGANISM="Picochlorum sp., Strain RCC944" /LENGTH=45 /DNA_ID= /DNA_START= /DNA_END= /DNA_ORIENTATION=
MTTPLAGPRSPDLSHSLFDSFPLRSYAGVSQAGVQMYKTEVKNLV